MPGNIARSAASQEAKSAVGAARHSTHNNKPTLIANLLERNVDAEMNGDISSHDAPRRQAPP